MLYTGDAFIGYTLRPGFQLKHARGGYSALTKKFTEPLYISVNSQGFRGPEFKLAKPNGVYRIFCLGGSSTWGMAVSDNQTYPSKLRQLFRQNFPNVRIEVINAGVAGYTTFHSLATFQTRILDYEPDMIIVYHSWNDVKYWRKESPQQRFGVMPLAGDYQPSGILKSALHRSYTYIILATIKRIVKNSLGSEFDPFHETRSDDTSLQRVLAADLSYGQNLFYRNLVNLTVTAKFHGVTVVLVNPLTLVKVKQTEKERKKVNYNAIALYPQDALKAFERIEDKLSMVSSEEHVEYINLMRKLPADLKTMTDHIHPTPDGHSMIAQVLFMTISKIIPKRLLQRIGNP